VIAVVHGCQGCGACLLTCPQHALRPVPRHVRSGGLPGLVVLDRCDGCGECVEVCPVDAITLTPTLTTIAIGDGSSP
jgi:NAD-dependent dihydropyrimidine dehydrogenase PreA subunit